MNFFNLFMPILKNQNRLETEDSDEEKQWIKIVFGVVLVLGYGGLHVPPKAS